MIYLARGSEMMCTSHSLHTSMSAVNPLALMSVLLMSCQPLKSTPGAAKGFTAPQCLLAPCWPPDKCYGQKRCHDIKNACRVPRDHSRALQRSSSPCAGVHLHSSRPSQAGNAVL